MSKNNGTGTERTKRRYEKADSKPLADLMDARGLCANRVAGMLGVSGSAVSAWVRTGEMPKQTALAVDALAAKMDDDKADTFRPVTPDLPFAPDVEAHEVIMISGPAAKIAKAKRVIGMMKLELVTLEGEAD